MRITRYRDLHNQPGYFNPETQADKLWRDLHGTRWAISKGQAYRETINELFTPYAFPGGYPILATTDNGDCLCVDCARKVYLEERIDVTVDIYHEGPSMFCDFCNVEIESAYGDPDENEIEISDLY